MYVHWAYFLEAAWRNGLRVGLICKRLWVRILVGDRKKLTISERQRMNLLIFTNYNFILCSSMRARYFGLLINLRQ